MPVAQRPTCACRKFARRSLIAHRGDETYYPGAFTAEGRALLKRLFPRLIAVDEAEAKALACNSVTVNDTVVMSTQQAVRVEQQLRGAGKQVIALDLSEFGKAGGGAKCLTLEAYLPLRRSYAVA